MPHHDVAAWRRLLLQAVVVLACIAARADSFAVKTDDNYESPLDEAQLAAPRSEVPVATLACTPCVCVSRWHGRVRACALCLCVFIRARASVYVNLRVRTGVLARCAHTGVLAFTTSRALPATLSLHLLGSSIDMYNNDVGKRFMK
jgi:hypothetical protein